jgi:hypothetical protein
MKTDIHFWSYLAQFFLEWKLFQTKLVEKIKTHFVFSKLFSENHGLCQKMWKNVVDRGKPQMTIWRIRVVCWWAKATNTRSQYVILIVLPLQQWLHESPSLLRHSTLLFLSFSQLICVLITLYRIFQLLLRMVTDCVFCEVRKEFFFCFLDRGFSVIKRNKPTKCTINS